MQSSDRFISDKPLDKPSLSLINRLVNKFFRYFLDFSQQLPLRSHGEGSVLIRYYSLISYDKNVLFFCFSPFICQQKILKMYNADPVLISRCQSVKRHHILRIIVRDLKQIICFAG